MPGYQTLRATGSRYLFPSRLHNSPHISIRQYARLVHRWESTVRYLGIEVDDALNIAEQIEL